MGLFSKVLGLALYFACLCFVVNGDVCEKGWVPYNKNCYQFTTNKYIKQASALGECQRLDASLLRIRSQDELTWLTTQMKTTYKTAGVWTDLNDNPKATGQVKGTGQWKWGMAEYADMSYIQWNQSPANDGRSNCAGINVQGTVSDISCHSRQGYVCKLPTAGGCPLGWLPAATACYWFSNTTDPSQRVIWSQAKTMCTNMQAGATLIVIADANDVTFLSQELPYLSQTAWLHWIGLQYNTNTSKWAWYTNDPVTSSLLHWQTEPDNIAGVENCAVLRSTGKFSDRSCTKSWANYVCFKPQMNANPVDNLGCGSWIRAGKLCYGFNRAMHKSWGDARTYCLQYSADLLKVDSFDKKAWLTLQLEDPTNDRYYWIGLNDQQSEGSYVWPDGSPLNTSYINWNQEPNDYKGQEDCGMITKTGQYNDMNCLAKGPAICEIDGLSQCPDSSWVSNNGNCYLFTPYNTTDQLYMQAEAADYCASFAPRTGVVGALLSVETKAEHDFIKAQVMKTNPAWGFWTSLNDKITEGYWAFATGPIMDSSLIDWDGEPSTAVGDNCGIVTWAGGYVQRNCNWKLSFICERYATGVTAGAGKVSSMVIASVLSVVLYFIH